MARSPYSKRELQARLQKLHEAGCPVGIEEKGDASALIKVAQDPDGFSWIGVNNDRLTYGMLWVNIFVQCSQIAICGYEVALPWDDPKFFLLPDPCEHDASARTYRFPSGGFEFARKIVLNHRRGALTRGERVNGVLMGVSLTPIPSNFAHGSVVDVQLSVISSLGNCSVAIAAQIDRSNERTARKLVRRTPLFELPDEAPAQFPEQVKLPKGSAGRE